MKKFCCLFALILPLFACSESEPEEKATPENKPVAAELELQPTEFAALAGWDEENWDELLPLWRKNCARINKLRDQYLDGAKIKIITKVYQKACRDSIGINMGAQLKQFVESRFVPFAVISNGADEGKFTAYYEAQINASRRKYGKYKYPIYGRPADLVDVNLQDFDANLPNRRLSGKVADGRLVPYQTRGEIEDGKIKAPVLLWGDDAVDIHIMQIQGSAVAKLDDGTEVRIGYDGNNGRSFRGIGSILLGKKLIAPGEAHMRGIKKWLRLHPEQAYKLMRENERYIFHRLNAQSGPIGTFQVPLTGGRSLAVDRHFIPLGSLLWLQTSLPVTGKINKLVAAQDTGSAIKGAVRGDYFWGSGGDDILEKAGSMNAAGRYFILLPKENND